MTSRLQARGLTLSYDGRVVVENLDFDVADGEVTAIIGPNGCGKSTLLKGLGRVMTPAAGAVTLDGSPLNRIPTRRIASQISLLPQSPEAPAGLTVAELVARGRHPHQRWFEQFGRGDEEIVREAMVATGVDQLADMPVDELSGGQRQRAWLSMTLAQQTDIVLLDEPTTYLDLAHQVEVLELVRDLHLLHGRTVLMVLHDISLAARYASRIVAMKGGRVVASGTPDDVVTEELLADVFGLRAAILREPALGRPHVMPLGLSADRVEQ
ncbi:ABC transporter ATP-binding protein [Microbacterium hydrocarbonoxydans]|uniref:ABC transporter ATP-binding protein n=1 Tax=Microbacterium hydrocarbonoxydans TaxID=273678 RepID=UPI0007BB5E59|nr:ABC transporter ATP-binding protein [Microbacterium hydrocarbonoxydans]GAT71930.1 ABC-type cobalamin/Fe3+-siderophores transport system [Microbacterium sp. HM58-2]